MENRIPFEERRDQAPKCYVLKIRTFRFAAPTVLILCLLEIREKYKYLFRSC